MKDPVISFVLVNNLGGITSMLSNVIEYRGPEALQQEAVILDIKENTNSPISSVFGGGIPVKHFAYSKKENWYQVFGNLAKVIGNGPGVLVTNDVYDMLMLQAFKVNKKVVQIVHDAYNVKLALFHGDVVDKFICHSYFFYEMLCQLMGGRKNDIVYLPYGIPLSGMQRKAAVPGKPLQLLFLGRHEDGKGIFDLYQINALLEKQKVLVNWLIMGRGPKTEELKKQWAGKTNVVFESPSGAEGVFENILSTDIFVFPTKFEGFPVALLEAMAAGVVPVATDLPGGLREVVKNGDNGFLCAENDNASFAEKIVWLHNNREALEKMSRNAFGEVNTHFNAVVQSPKYQAFFKETANAPGKPKHHSIKKKIGSRLDQPWMPNVVTKLMRRQFF